MKPFVKDCIGHFDVLLQHSQRPYEPQPIHILKRMVKPLCQDFQKLLADGTRNDAWEVIEGFSALCQKLTERTKE
jgi:hypothetical protein